MGVCHGRYGEADDRRLRDRLRKLRHPQGSERFRGGGAVGLLVQGSGMAEGE